MTGAEFQPIEDRLDERLRDYWLDRVRMHTQDSYAGIGMSKFPEDLRTYDHLLWETDANVVVEIGTQFGGSALWFRDHLVAFARYRPRLPRPLVISLDLDQTTARDLISQVDPDYESTICLVPGDVRDASSAIAIKQEVPPGSRCLVVEDSAHTYETTSMALSHFSSLVPSGVVEDGCVDIEEMRLDDAWPRGVLPALDDWLATSASSGFERRRDLERYGLTCHPRGYLQRKGVIRAAEDRYCTFCGLRMALRS
jgi:cephalosporin hydroxylase